MTRQNSPASGVPTGSPSWTIVVHPASGGEFSRAKWAKWGQCRHFDEMGSVSSF
jgi:hypothetical protein